MTATHPLQQVLQHLHAGRWNAAHDLVQQDGSLLGAWLHGILHLQEGDLEDAQSLFAISQGSRSGLCGRPARGWDARRGAQPIARLLASAATLQTARKDHCPKGWSEIGRLDATAACMGMSPCGASEASTHPDCAPTRSPARSQTGSANWYDRAARHFRSRGTLAEEIAALEAALAASSTPAAAPSASTPPHI
ncbi:hypothetical protein CLU88_1474 [Acidovorax sp. 56]|uniref:hypothetical protein n=1 Tax=Acidovorax sp. 56 TaxID=2035205 RepID=UPI000C4E855D|nr:hypothetical protein [Acidovorax sp. 56]PIF26611.1 hypothetical protein CLU88_1474 [Acidovorax sp. 56]